MSTNAGVWIDHRKAVIVTIAKDGEVTRTVESNAEKRTRFSSGRKMSRAHESQPGAAEDTNERRFAGQLDRFYEEVVAGLRDAATILIFGPGEAKGELAKRLEHDGLGARITGVERLDKRTDRQITARVRARVAAREHAPLAATA